MLFRGGAEARIRTKLLQDGNIDTVIGLPANLFFSTGIPVCILVLKKCKKPDDVLFINAADHFEKGKRQNVLRDADIEKNDFNLNISRYVRTSVDEQEIDLAAVHAQLVDLDQKVKTATEEHNRYLRELGLPELPL